MDRLLQVLSWTLLTLPQHYFGILPVLWRSGRVPADPYVIGVLVATLLLVVGVIGGLFGRERALLWFLLPVALAHLAVGVAGLVHGHDPAGGWATIIFLGVEALLIVWVVWRCRASVASIMIALFVASYAIMAGLLAAMALADTWV